MTDKNAMKYSLVAGGIVLNSEGLIVIVNQKDNSWSLPKGRINPSETDLQAAVREISEETGIPEQSLILIRPLGAYQRSKISQDGKGEDEKNLRRISVYLFTTSYAGPLKPTDPENPEAVWLKSSDVQNCLTHPMDKEFFGRQLSLIEEFLKK